MLNKTMCLLSLSLLLTTSTVNTKPMFVAEQSIEKINLKEMVQTALNNELLMNKLRVQNGEKTSIQLYIEEQERIRIEAEKQKKLEKERLKEQEESKQWREFELTFYTSLNCENSIHGAVNCHGQKLSRGTVANNSIPQFTQIYLEGYGEVTVSDKGSFKFFNNSYHLDVFIERELNESDKNYFNRVNNMGRQKVKGRIIK
ncbi:hypothetical protein [Clostridium botulinum]|uniref:hypothetical protein n=1 Tax=Clostridium botulinum TaxID=1491 RepID=UPI001C9A3E8B|nr:hypothetical protein [Clostridium botulinum]MBY6838651.1 hypothetical protein [Clostridium botulinum]